MVFLLDNFLRPPEVLARGCGGRRLGLARPGLGFFVIFALLEKCKLDYSMLQKFKVTG